MDVPHTPVISAHEKGAAAVLHCVAGSAHRDGAADVLNVQRDLFFPPD